MTNPTRTLTNADIELVAEKVNQKLFEGFGFDISTPTGRIEAASAFRMMLFWYRFWGIAGRSGIIAAASAAVTYAGYKWFGIGGAQ